ncbi:MAG: pentapeptide repeat-containing protein [Xenococcaceae cyanobacterium MO_167.B52]|nr:pentapeptide repeat-containing protein [Xenococcaceae cyanobacterium MO_167.B52]
MSRDALVVGINQYQDHRLRNLDTPAIHGKAIAEILEKYGDFNVCRLPEAIDPDTGKPYIANTQELSLTQLKKALVKLFKPQGRQIPDTALFYFSGHGIREDLAIQEGFLATSNVNPSLSFYGLSLQWLRRLLQESPIKQQIIWLDCCHSGGLLNFNEADPGEQGQARDRCFIAASRAFEASYEGLKSNYTALTKVLLEGLDPNRCPQEWITNYSLMEFINQNLRHEKQNLVSTNFGSPINLTRTLHTPISVSKGQDNDDICPYKGLEYFDFNESDPKYFYGREKLTAQLIDQVGQNNFLAILGASGSGKSSVLRAGLLHQLKLGRKLAGSQNWKIKIMLPGQHPLQSLAFCWLDSNLSDPERATQLDHIESLLKQGGEGLRKLVQASSANRVILVVDQFEEAFTRCQDLKERETFFRCLLEALDQTDNKLGLILAMRIDFFGKCVQPEYGGLGEIIQANLITIPPMETEELRQAIIKPAAKVKLTLESGLVEEILKDLEGSPNSLLLLQDTLTQLWQRRKNNQLKLSAYAQLGGIGGTLNQRATDVYKSLSKQEQDCAQHIFLSLTAFSKGTGNNHRGVFKQDLVIAKHNQDLIDQVVQKLADEKLIVTKNPIETNSEMAQPAEITLAYEALIKNWILLRQWLDEYRDLLRQKPKIEDGARDSQSSEQKTNYLLSKTRLQEANYSEKQQQKKYLPSKLTAKFAAQNSKYQKRETIKSLVLFSVISLIGTAMVGYFIVRELWWNEDKILIQNCKGKEYCQGRIEALARLVKARKSLKSYNLSGANLIDANLSDANLSDANLNFVALNFANLNRANLSGATLFGATLNRADLDRANLSDANLNRADLDHANLSEANLNGADLDHATLFDANLNGATLNGANLNRVNLNFANLNFANLIEAKNLTPSQIKLACYWEKAFYKGSWDNENGEWVVDQKANQEYIEELKKDQSSNPKEAAYCIHWQ